MNASILDASADDPARVAQRNNDAAVAAFEKGIPSNYGLGDGSGIAGGRAYHDYGFSVARETFDGRRQKGLGRRKVRLRIA